MPTPFPAYLFAAAALAGLAGPVRGAETAAAPEDPIAILLRERATLTGVKVDVDPQVFTGLFKVTTDLTGKSPIEALAMVNAALYQSEVQVTKRPYGTVRARFTGNPPHPSAPPDATLPPARPANLRMRMTNSPLDLPLKQLCQWTNRTLIIPADLLKGPSLTLVVSGPIPQSQAVVLLRDAFRQQAGLLLEEKTGNAWEARKDPAFVSAERMTGSLWMQDATVTRVLDEIKTASRKVVSVPPDVSTSPALITVGFSYKSKSEVEARLREALGQQAGIVLEDQPDGSLRVRTREKTETFTDPAAPANPAKP